MSVLSVWAPSARDVVLVHDRGRTAATAGPDGWWRADVPVGEGDRYAWSVDGADPVADPRAVRLPDGPHRPAAVYDPTGFAWTDSGWAAPPLADAVLYELHVGTFTPGGTLDAAVGSLGHLVDLGVTHVELMPLATWDGPRGWGYDGVAPWSVHEAYGGPAALQRFVDAAHARGLAVLLDVVHNHLGPSGNYLARFGPYFTDTHHTPWGAAVNLDAPGSDGVRAWLVDSVLSWLRDFHLDGLRLDAVHELRDDRAVVLLEEMSAAVDRLADELGRPLVLVAESDRNDPRTVVPREAGGLGVHAQWNDDVHHALHALLTGEGQGYYADFATDPYDAVARVLTGGYFHADTWSSFRGRRHGRPVDPTLVPGWRLVGSLQTHDQIGNRANGDRIGMLCSPGRAACGAALVLTSAFVPMLFMGEEWGASTPWLFFTSFPEPALGRFVSEGRAREFAEHGWSEDVPDPQAPATFERSRLDWAEVGREPHARLLGWYRSLIRLRRTEPDLRDPRLDAVSVTYDAGAGWVVVRRGQFRVVVNLAGEPQAVPVGPDVRRVDLAWAGAELRARAVVLDPESAAVVRA